MNSIWIARDKDGSLYAYQNKPLKMDDDDIWTCRIEGRLSRFAYRLNPDWFPEVTWDSEPMELTPMLSLGGKSLEEYIKDLKEKLDIIEPRKYIGALVDDMGNMSLTNEKED